MKKILFCLSALVIAISSFAQDNKNSGSVKITGTADTLVAPTYAEVYVNKQYNKKQAANTAMLQREIKRFLAAKGVDTNKVSITSLYNGAYGDDDKHDMIPVTFTMHVSDIGNIKNIDAAFTENGFSVMNTTWGVDDDAIDTKAIDKILLSEAIQNGKEKAAEVATQLGSKTFRLTGFVENAEPRNGVAMAHSRGLQMEKIKIEKKVTMSYRME